MRPLNPFSVVMAAALLAAAVGMGWLVDHAPGFAQAAAPPFDLADSAVIGEGAKLFRQTCTGYCHGKDGGPSRAPKLRGNRLERAYVYGRISKGSPNGMPAFETIMSRENIWKVTAYVLSLSKVEDQ